MLSFSTHNHFANKFNPERERRLLCISGNGNSGNGGGVEDENDGTEKRNEGDRRNDDLANIQTGTGRRILAQESANVADLANSPTVLLTIIEAGMLDEEQRRRIEERMRQAHTDADVPLPIPPAHIPAQLIVRFVREHPDQSQELLGSVREQLENPEQAVVIGQELEDRVTMYRNLDRVLHERYGNVIGPVDVESVEQFEETLEQHGCSLRDFISGTAEHSANLDKPEILRQVNIYFGLEGNPITDRLAVANYDQPESETETRFQRIGRKVLALVHGKVKRGHDTEPGADIVDGTDDEATRPNIAHRLVNAFNVARHRRLRNESVNLGSAAGSEIDQAGTIGALEQQILVLKQSVDNTLQQEAQTLYEGRAARLDARFRATGLHKDSEALFAAHGITSDQLAYNVLAPSYELPQRILREQPGEVREGEQFDLAPDVEDDHYFAYAGNALSDLRKVRTWEEREQRTAQAESRGARHYEDLYLEQAQAEHAEHMEWARHEATRLNRIVGRITGGGADQTMRLLQNLLRNQIRESNDDDATHISDQNVDELPQVLLYFNDLLQRFANQAEPSYADHNELFNTIDQWGLKRLSFIFDTLEDPRAVDKLQRYAAQREQRQDIENTEANQSAVMERAQRVADRLHGHEALNLTVSRAFHIPDGIGEKFTQVYGWLAVAREHEGSARALRELNQADELTSRLEYCANLLDGLLQGDMVVELDGAEFESIAGEGRAAFVKQHDRYEGKIIVNRDANIQPTDIPHELGHGLLHILTDQTGLFEGLHLQIHSMIRNDVPESERARGGNRNFDAILREEAESWGVTRNLESFYDDAMRRLGDEEQARAAADQEFLEYLVDELLNQYATWVEEGRPTHNRSANELILFEHLSKTVADTGNVPLELGNVDDEKLKNTKVALQTGHGEGDDAEANTDDAPESTEKEADTSKELRDTEQKIEKIRIFYASYPEYTSELEPHYTSARSAFDEIQKAYNTTQTPFENIRAALKLVNEYIKPIVDAVNKAEASKLNLVDETTTGKHGWRAIFGNVQFMSIMDIVKTFQQGWEDLNRIWKRRGEAKQAALGEGLTGWIPDSTPYAGRMKNEFRKRSHSSELEEVNHWKEALKDADDYALQNLLGVSRNRDQVRAILELLSERGRLDWNDKRLWRTLSAISNFAIPETACENNDVLRDKWLQKLITDIWDDKNHYFNWRQANDGGIKSGKDKFTPTVDQLANVEGDGMGAALKNMLETYVRYKDNRENMPEEVNPHLYEEILHYAMRMGKMSMEQKFFYLIQGVRYGLLSIDRIRVLAGDGGGVLNTFPFIDYFYHKNNTFEQVHALGERLDESGDKKFEPGLKTTLFVRMEIAREEAVKQRLRKGVSKQGENIDHDDIPYFLPELDYSGVNEWFANMSGSRQKLSKEALKNAYVGYSMKFKTFAALATMDAQGIKRFSSSDVRDMAQTIGAYIFADNILTRNGFDDDKSRPLLSRSEIENQVPVMARGGVTVGNYRDNVKGFVQTVLGKFLTDADWKEINKAAGNDTSKEDELKRDGKWITQEDYGGQDVEHNRANTEKAGKIYTGTSAMVAALERAITANPEGFKKELIRISNLGSAISTNNQYFIEDGVVEDKFTNETAVATSRQMGIAT